MKTWVCILWITLVPVVALLVGAVYFLLKLISEQAKRIFIL